MDVAKPCSSCGPSEPLAEGRSIPARRCLHRRKHPSPVDGCFGCKACGQSVSLSGHASARGDGISTASALKEEHKARANADPDRYEPTKTRAWIY